MNKTCKILLKHGHRKGEPCNVLLPPNSADLCHGHMMAMFASMKRGEDEERRLQNIETPEDTNYDKKLWAGFNKDFELEPGREL